MALSREEARKRERRELVEYLTTVDLAGARIPHELAVEAIHVFDQEIEASPDNVLWGTLRHMAGDPGTLRAKVRVRAARNGLDTARDEIIQRYGDGWQPVHAVSSEKGFVWTRTEAFSHRVRYETMSQPQQAVLFPQCVAGICDTCRKIADGSLD